KERERKDFAAATRHGERATAVAKQHLGATSPGLVAAADGLATTYRDQGQDATALALFQRLSLVELVLPPGAVVTRATPSVMPSPPRPRCVPRGSTAQGAIPDAASVVSGFATGFRRCYNQALRQDPEMKGTVRINAKIGAAGEVLFVRTL